MKKAWESPKLIVLVRSQPEETVLSSCKTDNILPYGPDAYFDICEYDALGFCEDCYTIVLS